MSCLDVLSWCFALMTLESCLAAFGESLQKQIDRPPRASGISRGRTNPHFPITNPNHQSQSNRVPSLFPLSFAHLLVCDGRVTVAPDDGNSVPTLVGDNDPFSSIIAPSKRINGPLGMAQRTIMCGRQSKLALLIK
jgi:hypothetical protein